MGRVGSVGIQISLKWAGIKTLHAHYMSPPGEYPTYKPKLLEKLKEEPWKIITLTREPVDRNISAFYRDLHKYSDVGVLGKFTPALYGNFIKNYSHSWVLNYFDKEFKKSTGVNVYKYPFDITKGWNIIKYKNLEILILRMENISITGKDAFKEFLDIEFKPTNTNSMREKSHLRDSYRIFRENANFSEKWLNKMYNSKYAKHFYSEVERNAYKKKWIK